MPDVFLIPRAERRVRLGHAWVFSNEIDTLKSPLSAYAPGDIAVVRDSFGKPVGKAYVNPGSLISARILTSDVKAKIDAAWWTARLRRALELREQMYSTPHYRAVYGESDGCPGLIIDRYADVVVAQMNTAGVVKMREPILEAIESVFAPRGVLVRSAGAVRQLEGIEALDEARGEVPEYADVREEESTFSAPLRAGQKTGYFYDQRDNRSRLERYVRGKRVLDVYSYIGSWGVRAMRFGAVSVVCCDTSQLALDGAQENARRNGVEIETVRGDAIDVLGSMAAERERFDVVIIDPPSLIKRRKDAPAGQKQYERLNKLAMHVLAQGGILVSSSCSHHLEPASLQRAILGAAKDAGRRAQILERHAHAPDHPIHPAMPETEYLKAFFVRA